MPTKRERLEADAAKNRVAFVDESPTYKEDPLFKRHRAHARKIRQEQVREQNKTNPMTDAAKQEPKVRNAPKKSHPRKQPVTEKSGE